MNLTPRFFPFGAVCAVLTALTTLVVHIVPNLWADATTFEQQVELRLNPIYMAQRWTILVHCALVILSMFALGAAKLRNAPALVSFGFLGYLCFGFTEIVRTSISIFAVNRTWRAGYAAAADDATRERFHALITAYAGINGALFFIFYTAFLIGLVCYGMAFLRSEGRNSHLGLYFWRGRCSACRRSLTRLPEPNRWGAISNGLGRISCRSLAFISACGSGKMLIR